MLSCQPHSLPAMTKSIMTCGQQRATRAPALACTHTTLRLRRAARGALSPQNKSLSKCTGKALHVTQHSEIFKHRIQTGEKKKEEEKKKSPVK